jgi:tripartite-type tricarboxylate transporter receptor subunit TctC
MKRKLFSYLAVFSFLISIIFPLAATSAWAADFPKRGITVVVSFPPGGGAPTVAQRIINIINENKICPTGMQLVFKPGGAGTIGLSEVLSGRPDGYTLAYSPSAPLIVQPLIKDLPYTTKSYTPIIQVLRNDWLLGVKADSPLQTIQEFIEYAKKHPGEVTVGTAGDYTWPHIALLDISKATGLKFRHVPFAGSGPSVVSLLGGHINAAIMKPIDISSQIEAGKARFIACAETKRSSFYPDVPTFNDLGFPVAGSFYSEMFVAPKGTPEEIIKILHDMFKKAIDTDDYKAFIKAMGANAQYEGYKELPATLEAETKKVKSLLQELGTEIKAGN